MGARPVEQKKGADHGIDGKILFRDDAKTSKTEKIIIRVKGGKTGVKDVRDLRGVLDRENAAMEVLISVQPPTRDMVADAVSAGFYEDKSIRQRYPRPHLPTVKELLEGKAIGNGLRDVPGSQRLRVRKQGGIMRPSGQRQASYKPEAWELRSYSLRILLVFASYSLRIHPVSSGGPLRRGLAGPPHPTLILTVLVGRSFKWLRVIQ